MKNRYHISTEPKDIDIEAVHAYLSQSYWASGIPLETLRTAINNSLCFGVFNQQHQQVGFARIISDKATFAYLADVYILEDHRGLGLSKQLIECIIAHPELQGLRRMMLATQDAHGLYEQFGFKALASADMFMERHTTNIYSQAQL